MKRYNALLAILLSATLLAGCNTRQSAVGDRDKPLVLASFYTMADFAGKIGGDRIEMITLVPAGTEPHDWEPTAKDMANLEAADMLVLNGAGFEHWVDGVIPTLANVGLVVVETAAALSTLPEAQDNKDHGHEAGVDPHVWLNPINAKLQMAAIRDSLIAMDPEGAGSYNQNYEKYAAQCDQLDQEYRDTLSPLPGKEIVVAHQAFGYLCAQYGLTQLAVQGLSPEGEPDPAQMAQVIAYSKERRVKVVFFEELTSPKVAEAIAREIGASTAVLSPLEGLSDQQAAEGGDYFSVMRENLQQLKVALE